MRKTFNPVSDSQTADSLELAKRLLKGIMDIGKHLDEQRSHASTVLNIFSPSGEILRRKLRDYCERLIFKDPIVYVARTEGLLWRKGFYDVVSTTKKLRKGNTWNDQEKALLSIHLAVGVGFYHHLILKLQSTYSLDLMGIIDFAFVKSDMIVPNPKSLSGKSKSFSHEVTQCIMRLIHRSLVCLGDLARYRLDLDPNWDPMMAERYYKMAISIDPNIGMPHNQLGTLAGNKNYGLDAVYYYMRCVLCPEPFDGAEGNLKRIIFNYSICSNDKCFIQLCVSKLFTLLQLWDQNTPNSGRVNHQCQDLLNGIENCLSMESIQPENQTDIGNESSIEVYLQNCKNEKAGHLTDDMIFKIVTICLMSISRLKMKESSEVQGVIAVTLAILSQLIQIFITRLQESVIDSSSSEENQDTTKSIDCSQHANGLSNETIDAGDVKKEKLDSNENVYIAKTKDKVKSLLTKLRRPRKRRNSSDSEASDNEETTMATSSDEMNSDISETEDVLSEGNILSEDGLSDEMTDEESIPPDEKTNGHIEINSKKDKDDLNKVNHSNNTSKLSNGTLNENEMAEALTRMAQEKKEKLKPEDLLNILMDKELLTSIKICCDWLRSNQDIVKICAKSSRILLKRIVVSLNLINVEPDILLRTWNNDGAVCLNMDKLNDFVKSIPLPEDTSLRGLGILEDAHKDLHWNILHKLEIKKRDITLLRVLKLIEFGHYLITIENTGMTYDNVSNTFKIEDIKETNHAMNKNGESIDKDSEHPRKKLMRHMGKLWLKAEVRALENRVRSKLISPYLVPDHEALTKHMPILKRLVYAKKFVIVIPTVVVSALDEIKRTSSKAREATRWLETQLRRGSRFLRAQRPHERLPIPFLKGPKAKDKEAWLFFQITECCHYFTQQSKVGLNHDSEAPVVTLLTGFSPLDKKSSTLSPIELIKNAGVNLEYIESFHTKWKTSSKSHG